MVCVQPYEHCDFSARKGVIRVADTGIQESLLVYKQTSIGSGYNVFDEIIWKTGFQCQALE
ncbi:hypothetical protein [Wolbachia endosymbiont (group A) of Aleiodes leptofemur]|uniref:hypothetical protein n=1 Tax=Wolbachia endosymbiont (group A) of Aleiodes leptofemur TaxID=3077919 RepID=UPI00333F8036